MNPLVLRLSPRQIEVMLRIASGDSAKAISAELRISEHTVEAHAQKARDRIVAAYPDVVRSGAPRAVILRYYALVERRAFANGSATPQEAGNASVSLNP